MHLAQFHVMYAAKKKRNRDSHGSGSRFAVLGCPHNDQAMRVANCSLWASALAAENSTSTSLRFIFGHGVRFPTS